VNENSKGIVTETDMNHGGPLMLAPACRQRQVRVNISKRLPASTALVE
jgi:hypothetical protein